MTTQQELLTVIQENTKGLTLQEILEKCPSLAKRTAQRWLATMQNATQVHAIGQGRARRFFPGPSQTSSIVDDDFPADIPLSPGAHEVLNYINQPLSARKPVGYDQGFLEEYIPNETFYLSAPARRQLHNMGQTIEGDCPAGTYGREILDRLLVDLSWASSHLEGNTYSRLDTVNLIEHGQAAEGKNFFETQMILNHKSAIELLVEHADSVDFNRFTVMNLHACLSEGLLSNMQDEGRLRQHIVEIGKSVYKPLSVPQLISDMFDMLLEKANRIEDSFEQAFFVMVHIPYLQPFADVNKRTSRLAANLPLIRANLCPLTFLDVPEKAYSRAILGVYELRRLELLQDLFIWAYTRSTQAYITIKRDLIEPDPMALKYRDLIRQLIKQIVITCETDSIGLISRALVEVVPASDREHVQALVIEKLTHLHEGSLARYGLRLSEFERYKKS